MQNRIGAIIVIATIQNNRLQFLSGLNGHLEIVLFADFIIKTKFNLMIPKSKLLDGIVSTWFQWQALQKNISKGKNDERCQKNEQDTLYNVFYGIFHGPSFSGILTQAMSGYKRQ